ncbi:phage late control D family protein [Pantoea sp. KPR_PJ]|uniref:phage late control D family protein n=1 Tax=Pantoea sp. KPR_PJ TaxID=2738375 RepID=UPI003528F518
MAINAGSQLASDFMLWMGGKDVTANLRHRLISLTLTDNRGFEADTLNITLDDSDGLLQLPQRGTVVSLFLGWVGQLHNKGDFTVDQVSHGGAPDVLTLTARSVDFRGELNKARDVSYHDTTLGTVVTQIAARCGLILQMAEGFAGIKIDHIDQTHETDPGFVTRLAKRYGAAAIIKAGRLLFLRPGSATLASGNAIPVVLLTRQDGDRHRFTIADRTSYTGVQAKWLAVQEARTHVIQLQRKAKAASADAVSHPEAKSASPPAGEQEGAYLAGQKDSLLVLPDVFNSKEAAMQAAEAKWKEIQRGVVHFTFQLAAGRADLFPETPVRVSGFKTPIDNSAWIIDKLTHSLSANGGFTTTLELECDISEVEYEEIN